MKTKTIQSTFLFNLNRFVIVLCLTLSTGVSSTAQKIGKIWGMTNGGGDSAGGVIFNYDPLSGKDSLIYSFNGITPKYPKYANLIQGADGNLYGVTSQGGVSGFGTVFKCTITGTVTVLASFNGTNGKTPTGSLLLASDGNFYGMASVGGSTNDGVIFKCTPTGSLTVLVSFNHTTGGATPYGSLVQDKKGDFYGMTEAGGAYTSGVIFKCTIWGTLTTIYNLKTTYGRNPYGNLIFGSDSNLYGVAQFGGTGVGTMFKCSRTGTLTNLASFATATGIYPYGSLIQATDGNFYGMTTSGGSSNNGTIFKYDTSLHTIAALASFNGTNGSKPYGSLIQAADGNLYGMTNLGGVNALGTLFSCTTSGTITKLVDFNGAVNGTEPYGGLLQLADGNLYGMTYSGGPANGGTIFSCTTSGTITRLASFGVTALGNTPANGLIQAIDGNLYGTTIDGGSSGRGTVFKCSLSGVVTTLANFNDTNGSNPYCAVVQATDGNFYGTTGYGGSTGNGTIFRCTPSGLLTKLIDFNGTNGSKPLGGMIQGVDGNLYGMTFSGGTGGYGTIYSCTLSGTLTTLFNFHDSAYGLYAYGTLLQANNGNLYGMTYQGGTVNNDGILFKCTTSGIVTPLVSFTGGASGANPYNSLMQASNGNLYGMTYSGGVPSVNNYGILFKYNLSGTYTDEVNFSTATGIYPRGDLMEASDGNLYGMTYQGGSANDGTFFKFDTTANSLTTLFNFKGTANGANHTFGKPLEVMSSAISSIESCSGTTLVDSVRGAKSPYTYLWSNGATTSSITGIITARPCSLTVTDARGIHVTTSFNVAHSIISVVAGSNMVTCNGTSVGLSAVGSGGSGALLYTWMPGTLNGSTQSVSPANTATYTVVVTDGTCSVTATQVITVNQPSSSNLAKIACGSYTLNNITYSSSNTYSQQLVNNAGCDSIITLNLTINPLPVIGIIGVNNINEGSADTLKASGAVNYVWTSGSTSDTTIVSPALTTTYTVTGTDGNGCKDTASYKVVVNTITGVNNNGVSVNTVLYPNPVNTSLNITFNTNSNENAVLKILDVRGAELISENIMISNEKKISFDISPFAAGNYFVKVITDNSARVIKFVKE